MDLEGNLTSLNKAAERITGYSRAEALQMKLDHFVAPDHQEVGRRMMERQISGESPATSELEILTKEGSRVALEISTHVILRDGRPVGIQGIARDITERKKTEEALQQAKQNLEAWVHELEQRTREMTLLSEMGDMLRACLSTDEAYSVIVRVAQQIFPVQVGALYVISPSRNLVEAVAVWGDSSLIERVFAPDECWALRRGRVHLVEDSSAGLLCKHLHQPPPEGYLCVPMMAQSEALGILYLAQPADVRLTEAKQRLAVAMAEHIAMALSNLKLHETLRSQSIRDPLTGLFNRRFMEESLELELRRAARNRRPLGIIMLEVDDFQAVSRSMGDVAEDSILLELGGLLRTIIRKEDIACRFGAEKFTIILPQGNLEVTSQRAESLREMIRSLEIRHRGRPLGHISISAGIAGFPEQGRTVEALIRVVDAALQRAKHEGGDRIVIAQ
jgi:diguanylate cyclase (GGDEF)-like protein/PAS domain S-box-containing protein